MRGRAVVARRAHNPEVLGSNPSPATKKRSLFCGLFWFESTLTGRTQSPATKKRSLFCGLFLFESTLTGGYTLLSGGFAQPRY